MITIDTWKGLVTNASPYTLPPGAAVTQVNWQCVRPGELNTRGGQSAVTFSAHSAGATAPVVMVRHQLGADECIVYQNATGELRVARGLQ